MKLVDSWNRLWGQIDNGVGTVIAIAGVLIIAIFVLKWFWDRRKGQGKGFPFMAVILGLALAGPNLVIPVLLGLFEAILNFIIGVVKWITGLL